VPDTPVGLRVGSEYHREEAAQAMGLPFVDGGPWKTGVVPVPSGILFFVTLDKSAHPREHQYADAFEDDRTFRWQSQNREAHSNSGRRYLTHIADGVQIRLFVRPEKMDGPKAMRFVYLGQVDYQRSRGDKPMTVWWRLETPLTPPLRKRFGVRLARPPGEWNGLSVQDAPPDQAPTGQEELEVEEQLGRGDFSAPDAWVARKIRAGQRVFRQKVLANFDNACAICGIDDLRLLDAAHIVSWTDDPANRLNPQNGLALCALHHRALDCGILQFNPDATIVVTEPGFELPPFLRAAIREVAGKPLRRPRRSVDEFLRQNSRRSA
jgi:hypothetical protein